jgi:PTH1 family peptidyl-tRNA hydrolase
MRTKVIIGLGNPPPVVYWDRHNADCDLLKDMHLKGLFEHPDQTRHNAGFRVVTKAAGDNPFYYDRKFTADNAAAFLGGHSIILVRPMTGMNTSGTAAKVVLNFFDSQPQDLLLVYDDIALPLGELRFQAGAEKAATGGGHNGVKSVIAELGSNAFDRLKIGVGKPEPGADILTFVLSTIPAELRPEYEVQIQNAAQAVEFWCKHGVQEAMTFYNRRK